MERIMPMKGSDANECIALEYSFHSVFSIILIKQVTKRILMLIVQLQQQQHLQKHKDSDR